MEIRQIRIVPRINRAAIFVNADIGNSSSEVKGSNISSHIDKHGLLPRYVLEPESSIPRLPEMPDGLVFRKFPYSRPESLIKEQFTQVERVSYHSNMGLLPYLKVKKPVQVFLNGPLAERSLVKFPIKNLAHIAKRYFSEGQSLIKIHIQVNDKTGKVFWTKLTETSGNKYLDQIARRMVKLLEFERVENSFISEGEIEILFTADSYVGISAQLGQEILQGNDFPEDRL